MLRVEILLSLYILIFWTVIKEVTSERKIVKLRDRVKRDVDILADCGDQCLSKDQITDYDVLLEYDYGDDENNETNKHKPDDTRQPCIYACKILDLNKTNAVLDFSPFETSKNRSSNYEIVEFSSFEKLYDKNAEKITVTFPPAIKYIVPTKASTEISSATVGFEMSKINVPLVPTTPCLCSNNTSHLRNETTLKSTLVEGDIKGNTPKTSNSTQKISVNQSHFLQTVTNFTTASKEQNYYGKTTVTPLLSVVPVMPKIIRLSVLEAEMVKAESASHPSLKSFQVPGVSDFNSKIKNISWPETYSENPILTFNTEMINRINEHQELNYVLNDQNTISEQEKDLIPKIKSKLTRSSTVSTPIVSLTLPNIRQSASVSITLPTSKPGQNTPVVSTKPVTARFDDISKKSSDIVTSSLLWPELTSTLKSSNQHSQTISAVLEPTVSTNLNNEAMISSVVSQTVKLSTERSITPKLPWVTASINKPDLINPSSVMPPKSDSLIRQNTFMSKTSPVLQSSSKLGSVPAASSKQGLLSAQGSTYGLPAISNALTDVGSTLSELQTSSLEDDSGPTMTLELAKSGEVNGSEPKFFSIQTNMSKPIYLDSPLSTIPTRLSEFDPFSTPSTVIANSTVNSSELTLPTILVSLSKQADLVSTLPVVSTNSSDRNLVLHKRLNSSAPNYSSHTLFPTTEIGSEKNAFRSALSTPGSSSGLNVSFSTLPTVPASLSELITSTVYRPTITEVLSKLNSDLTMSTMAAFTGNGLIYSGSTESTITKSSMKIDSESTESTIAASLNTLIVPDSISSKILISSTELSDIASTVAKMPTSIFQTSGSMKSKILASLVEKIKPSTVMSTVPSIGLNSFVPSVSSMPASSHKLTVFASSSTTLPMGPSSSKVNHSQTVSSIPKMEMTASAGTPKGLQNLTNLMSARKIKSEFLYKKSISTSTEKSTNMHTQNNSTYPMFVGQTTRFNSTTLPPTFNDTPVLNSAMTKTNDAAIPNETKLNSSINLKKLGIYDDYYDSPFESLEHISTNMSTMKETLLA